MTLTRRGLGAPTYPGRAGGTHPGTAGGTQEEPGGLFMPQKQDQEEPGGLFMPLFTGPRRSQEASLCLFLRT